MTAEMYDYISREFAEAEKAGDDERMSRIMVRAILAMLDCQRKTSDRVKEILAREETARAKLSGAKLAWDALKILSAAGGGALILKLLAVAGAA
jgi:hypothetical protein